jgi:hypothetical protein
VPWPFRLLFFRGKPGVFVIWRKVESQFIKADDELPAAMLDGMELA